MNKKELKVGMEIKTYNKMVAILEEEYKKCGKSRMLQLEDWKRYFNYRKEGQRFIILEIYDKPKDKIDGRGKSEGSKNNHSIYSKYIQKLILDLLVQKMEDGNNGKIYLSKDRLLYALGMISKNYTYCKFNRKLLAKFLEIDKEVVKDFYMLNDQNLKGTLNSAIKSLESKSLIICNIVLTVCIEEKYEITNFNEKILKFVDKVRTATDEEREVILNVEKEVLIQMGYNSKQHAFLSDAYKSFIDRVNIITYKEARIKYYYKSYDIIFHKKYIKQEQEKLEKWLLQHEERENTKVELNDKLVKNYFENAKKKHKKAKIKCNSILGKHNDDKINMRANEKYPNNYKKIIGTVIDNKANNIVNKLDKKQISLQKCS